ncbi:MAG: peptidylprolyl isomerase [Bacteroidetes bacterium]|nr:peptidylprolyl isomerase [Bacteroidota bacterium]MBL6943190.1 peptidylprolyl isomerase [Bacteroidales bacterium]
MAAIGNIRKHSTFLVIVIGVALAAFVLGDFARGGGGSRNVNVGEVEGEEITIMDFNSEAEKNIDATMQQQQKDRLTSDEIFSVKEQTWNDIVRRVIMDNEYDALGLSVTADELFDLIQGPDPHPLIKQYFADPNTKQYDRNLVVQYLQNMESLPDDSKLQWIRFEKYIKDDMLRNKFNALISNGYYVPTDLARVLYSEKNDKANIDYVAAKFIDINDSLFNPSDDDYAEYYSNHKEQYKQDASRDIEYVVLNIVPSAKDIEDSKREMDQIAKELRETVDVVRFVKVNSDTPYDSSWFAPGKLPVQIDSLMFNSKIGTVSDPYLLNNEFHVARLMEIGRRHDSMRASHILISYAGAYNARPEVTRDHDQASDLADSLFNVLKRSPGKMETLAKEFSNDPSVEQNNSDLGWFEDGKMVYDFNEAVYNTKVGTFTISETPFGFHIIEVTGKKDLVKKVKVAMINREIYASDETYQKTFAVASKIATECETLEDFNNALTEQSLNKRTMPGIREMSNYIAGLTNPRQIIRWAFNENTVTDQVSSVFDLDNMFVVAVLTAKVDEGYPTLEQVKDRIKQKVYNQLKGEYFTDKMNEYNDDLAEIKANMNVVDKQVNPLYFSSRNLPGFTIENEVMGTVFGMKNGAISKPIIGNSGVFVVKVNDITLAGDITNYTSVITELHTEFKKRVDQDYPFTAVKESLKIVDNRIDFY